VNAPQCKIKIRDKISRILSLSLEGLDFNGSVYRSQGESIGDVLTLNVKPLINKDTIWTIQQQIVLIESGLSLNMKKTFQVELKKIK
jgi:hypothetical protein